MTELQLLFKEYIKDYSGEFFSDEPLKNHCTFRTGGAAEILFVPKNENSLIAAVSFAADNNIDFHLLGNGSNVLVPDEGLKGIVLKLMGGMQQLIYLGDGMIACSAGVSLKKLCLFALEHSLSGLEFAYGIPGSVGGAVYMNAGAYGGEIKNVLYSVRHYDKAKQIKEEVKLCDMEFSYRSTPYMNSDKIITAAYFSLTPGKKEDIAEKMAELLNKRKLSQPLEYPSAGSTFKRPETGYAAAMIDECGLKGLSVGGAMVSEKHAGFIINTGSATSSDILQLIEKVQHRVYEKCGVKLTPEVEILH